MQPCAAYETDEMSLSHHITLSVLMYLQKTCTVLFTKEHTDEEITSYQNTGYVFFNDTTLVNKENTLLNRVILLNLSSLIFQNCVAPGESLQCNKVPLKI